MEKQVAIDDRDPPPWMNKQNKKLIEQKNQFYFINRFKVLRDKLGFLIDKLKTNYYSKMSQSYLMKLLALKLTGQS